MFARGGFVLRKWNLNDHSILKQIPEALRDSREVQAFPEADEYCNALGIEWNVVTNQFRIAIAETPQDDQEEPRV